jgi:hypothetical protein
VWVGINVCLLVGRLDGCIDGTSEGSLVVVGEGVILGEDDGNFVDVGEADLTGCNDGKSDGEMEKGLNPVGERVLTSVGDNV